MRDKLKTPKQLRALAVRLRARGKRIVFTNGCFDLLHAGHVQYLQKARSLGDILIVGMNSDRSVRKIKGPPRPIIPQGQRASVLAGLACVDFIGIFDEPDPRKMIASLLPNVLVKGKDWAKDRMIGNDIVKSRGGKVITIPLLPHVSTTSIIKSIIRKYGIHQADSRTAPKTRR